MPKHDAFSPKGIANRIKAKGLQKLKWWCQICQKQCRDENGFKCHCMSEGHQRMMQVFGDRKSSFISEYTKGFEHGMLSLISTRFRSKRVLANVVYNEYIKDKQHVHMNATRWHTLSGFVAYLGKTGKCKVDQTEQGLYITYIPRDDDKLAQREAEELKKKADIDDEERTRRMMQKRVKFGLALNGTEDEDEDGPTDIQREVVVEDSQKISFSLSGVKKESVKCEDGTCKLEEIDVEPQDIDSDVYDEYEFDENGEIITDDYDYDKPLPVPDGADGGDDVKVEDQPKIKDEKPKEDSKEHSRTLSHDRHRSRSRDRHHRDDRERSRSRDRRSRSRSRSRERRHRSRSRSHDRSHDKHRSDSRERRHRSRSRDRHDRERSGSHSRSRDNNIKQEKTVTKPFSIFDKMASTVVKPSQPKAERVDVTNTLAELKRENEKLKFNFKRR